MKEKYLSPTIKELIVEGETTILSNSGGGVIGEAPDMQGEMNCPCDGDESKCNCYKKNDYCDCWGCGGFEVKGFDF